MRRLCVVVVCALLAGGCSAIAQRDDRLEVVASISPLFDALGGVGGREVHAVNLAPLDPYGPLSPKREQQLRDADLAVVLGGGTQPDIEQVAAERTAPTLAVIDELSSPPDNFWLDPRNMMVVGQLIRDELSRLRPERAEAIGERHSRFHRTLNDVDRINERTLATCGRREFQAEQDFGALAVRFGLVQSPIDLRDHEDQLTVFWSNLPDLETAQGYLRDHNLRSSTLDTMEVRTDQARRGGANYGSLTALNLDALRSGLDCDKVKLGDT